MPEFLKVYGNTPGPLGVPMSDKQAFALEERLKQVPQEDRQIVKATLPGAISELAAGERADVSWITKEVVDRDKELLVTAGLDESHFALNPLVTCNHNYWRPPVGKSLWRKRTKDGATPGVKAKTHYPSRPGSWPQGAEWEPDSAFALVQAGLMTGKSVGAVYLESHAPTAEEIRKRPDLAQVRRIVDKWLLIEYSCCWLPSNQEAITEAVSKSVGADFAAAIGLTFPVPAEPPSPVLVKTPEVPAAAAFCTEKTVQAAVEKALASLNLGEMINRGLQSALDRHKGRV